MQKMNLNDASAYLGISKEAIHNRVRRGSLESVVEDGVKYVFIDEKQKTVKKNIPVVKVSRIQNSDDKYYKLLEEQNLKLQLRIETLENETRTLRDQKELMLVQEREKIEQIYKDKDEQLKNILSSFSAQFMLNKPVQKQEDDPVEVEIEEVNECEFSPKIIPLKKFLKDNISEKRYRKVKERFIKKAKKDSRIIIKKDKYFVDINRYDYSDLL